MTLFRFLCFLGFLSLVAFRTVKAEEVYENSIGMSFVSVPAGSFTMGSPESEKGRGEDEGQIEVSLGAFWMAETEVTQKQWLEVMSTSIQQQIEEQKGPIGRGAKLVAKISAEGPEQPMCFVSWEDAVRFCEKLTELEKEKLPEGKKYTLPTEAEWEYACRAGTKTVFSFGDSLSSEQANFYGPKPYGDAPAGEYREMTVPVKTFPANPWGLFEMHGNVYEWCLDIYAPERMGGADPLNEKETGDDGRVIRGGTWNRVASSCRSAYRYSAYPYTRAYNIGFRVVIK